MDAQVAIKGLAAMHHQHFNNVKRSLLDQSLGLIKRRVTERWRSAGHDAAVAEDLEI